MGGAVMDKKAVLITKNNINYFIDGNPAEILIGLSDTMKK